MNNICFVCFFFILYSCLVDALITTKWVSWCVFEKCLHGPLKFDFECLESVESKIFQTLDQVESVVCEYDDLNCFIV